MVFGFAHFQDVYLEFPLMTNYGTFIINGAERVIVLMHRSLVSSLIINRKKVPLLLKVLSARIIPNRAWMTLSSMPETICST